MIYTAMIMRGEGADDPCEVLAVTTSLPAMKKKLVYLEGGKNSGTKFRWHGWEYNECYVAVGSDHDEQTWGYRIQRWRVK